jgi:hypothetical protein
MEKYKFDVVSQTLTVTANFADKMNDPSSDEYKLVVRFQSDFPNLKIAKRTHKSPSKCTSKATGEKFNCNQFKNLTCDRMEKFIAALPNNEAYKREFEFVRYTASSIQTNGYKQVREWFVAQFPEFRKNPLFYLNNAPEVVDGAKFLNDEAAISEAKAA